MLALGQFNYVLSAGNHGAGAIKTHPTRRSRPHLIPLI